MEVNCEAKLGSSGNERECVLQGRKQIENISVKKNKREFGEMRKETNELRGMLVAS